MGLIINTFTKLAVICSLSVTGFLLTAPSTAQAIDPGRLDNNESPQALGTQFLKRELILPQLEIFLQPQAYQKQRSIEARNLRGWNYVFDTLVNIGFDPDAASLVFSDRRMPFRQAFTFSVAPKESKNLYRMAASQKQIKAGISCYGRYEEYFEQASKRYQIPKGILVSILQIETRCGMVLGRTPVLPRLALLSSAPMEENIEKSVHFNTRVNRQVTREQVVERAKWLESTFLPHVVATFGVAKEKGLHPLEVKGSGGGAFGIPQFLPANVYFYGVDANGDGRVNLLDPHDAIFSLANYLKRNGWTEMNLPLSTKKEVIFSYNRSEPYVASVLTLADGIERVIEPQTANLK